MPIYEYQCTHCGAAREALQKMSDAPLVDCIKCGNPTLKKKISAAAFRLKGGGWYETDFKSGNKKNLTEGAGAESGGESASKNTENESLKTAESTSDRNASSDSASASASVNKSASGSGADKTLSTSSGSSPSSSGAD